MRLLNGLKVIDEDQYMSTDDPCWAQMIPASLELVLWGCRLEHFYPLREITITSKDPDYITPKLHTYFVRKTDSRGRENRKTAALELPKSSPKQRMWTQERDQGKRWTHSLNKPKTLTWPLLVNVEDLNRYFVAMSADPLYSAPSLKLMAHLHQCTVTETASGSLITFTTHQRGSMACWPGTCCWYQHLLVEKLENLAMFIWLVKSLQLCELCLEKTICANR